MPNINFSNDKLLKVLPFAVAMLVGLCIFYLKFSVRVLNPTDYNWMPAVGTDMYTEYISWEYYRRTPWHFPIIGQLEGYCYPTQSGIGLTGLIPLLAIPLKALVSIEKYPHFQYIGWWYLLCYLLQGYFGAKVIRTFKLGNVIIETIASSFVVLSSSFLFKTPHISMVAHWLILYAFWIYFADWEVRKKIIMSLCLLTLTALIQQYILAMVLGITFVTYLKMWKDGKVGFLKSLSFNMLGLPLILGCWYIVGNFNIPLGANETEGYGVYSANINTLFNSFGWNAGLLASFYPHLPTATTGQYEGFAYLGFGMIILLFISFVLWIKKCISSGFQLRNTSLLFVISILFMIFSWSNVITFNDKILMVIPLKGALLSLGNAFRATGRFIWVLLYFIFIGSTVTIARQSWNTTLKAVILGVAFLIQWIDLAKLYTYENIPNLNYQSVINISEQQKLLAGAKRVVLYPLYQWTYSKTNDMFDFASLAAQNNQGITSGFFARQNQVVQGDYSQQITNKIAQGDLSGEEQSVFICTENQGFVFHRFEEKGLAKAFKYEGYTYVVPNSLPQVIQQFQTNPNVEAQTLEGERIDQYLLSQKNWVAIAVSDEAAYKISQETKDIFAANGSQLKDLRFRGSYMGLWHEGKPVFEQLSENQVIGRTFQKGEYNLPIALKLQSAGAASGKSEASIMLNSKEEAKNLRGLNIVVFDETGKVLNSFTFDTYVNEYRLKDKN